MSPMTNHQAPNPKQIVVSLKSLRLNPKLLKTALTHCSYLNEHPGTISNERLEFLGDAVIEFLISEELYRRFPQSPEGQLTAMRSNLVQTKSFAKIAKKLQLGKALLLSKGEEMSGGRDNPALLENTFEALLGAIYLDQGVNAAKNFLKQHLFPEIDSLNPHDLKDPKSLLQETIQAQNLPTPTYQVLKQEGPDHLKKFQVVVKVGPKQLATGSGTSKQRAQQSAARQALTNIQTNPHQSPKNQEPTQK